MTAPVKAPRCRICGGRVNDPADHEECLKRGNPQTGYLYRELDPPEPPEPRY